MSWAMTSRQPAVGNKTSQHSSSARCQWSGPSDGIETSAVYQEFSIPNEINIADHLNAQTRSESSRFSLLDCSPDGWSALIPDSCRSKTRPTVISANEHSRLGCIPSRDWRRRRAHIEYAQNTHGIEHKNRTAIFEHQNIYKRQGRGRLKCKLFEDVYWNIQMLPNRSILNAYYLYSTRNKDLITHTIFKNRRGCSYISICFLLFMGSRIEASANDSSSLKYVLQPDESR